jgi:hypothetical protein
MSGWWISKAGGVIRLLGLRDKVGSMLTIVSCW